MSTEAAPTRFGRSARPQSARMLRARLAALLAALLATVLLAAAVPGAAHAAGKAAGTTPARKVVTHTVTYDQYSFLIDGVRTYLWSGEFHYYRLPSPDLWRDVLQKMKAGGFNAVSLYFDWAYHSPRAGVYDFSGVRDVDRLLSMAADAGIYVIARPGPYINAEVDSGGFPGWLTTQQGRARSAAPDYLAAADEWLSHIDPILARHQLTKGTGTVITYQVENEFYDGSPAARQYMAHLEQKVRADGITVPLVGNHNNVYNTGVGAVDVDMPDGYPQGFNCSNPTRWNGVGDLTWARSPGKPLGIGEFQGGAFDPWGGPGYDKCRQLTGPDFENVFYKNNIAQGVTQQSFYMTYGGTSWGWQPDPQQVYTSYDYGAPITEGRQLGAKYDEDKRIGYFTQAVAPLTKTDPLAAVPPTSPAIVDTARINPDDHTQFHVLRHADSTSTATDSTHITLDLGAGSGYTYDDVAPQLAYTGSWSHVGAEQNYTGGDYQHTESFSAGAGDSITVPFTGTAVRWISSRDGNHGTADVYLDGAKVATVDGYARAKANQQVFYSAGGLTDGPHTLKIVVTGTKNPAASGTFVVVDAIDLPAPGAENLVYPSVPQQPGTALTFAGRDSKIIVANYRLGSQSLRYSTSEIMTHAQIGDRDVALLYGRAGQDGETLLHYAAQPTVTVLDGDVRSTWDAARGDLRLNYTHSGLARVLVTGGARPLLLLLATDEVAATFWQQQTPYGPVLVRGPYLLRTASGSHGTLALAGDTSQAGDLEVFGGASTITWNGRRVNTRTTSSGSRLGSLAGPKPVTLPALTDWKHAGESPESQPGFDDSTWRVADKMTTNSVTAPATLPVLFADDYGFHYGDVWYRGRFRGTGKDTGVNLSAITGRAGAWSVWLNGQFLGTATSGQKTFTFPAGAVRTGADNVLSVLVENMGHNEDYNSGDSHKEARGLTGATLTGSPLGAITWRIQGDRGGETPIDPVRGPMNNGGLYGERAGWSLPGYPDSTWSSVSLPNTDATPGVSWYRTTVKLDLPRGQDTSVGLRIDDDPARHYRAQIFVNGWQLGRYLNDVGPQHSFPIPTGILKPNGENTVAIAVWNTDATTGGLGKVSLESYGTRTSALSVADVNSPRYQRDRYALPAAPRTTISLAAPDTIQTGQTIDVAATIGVPAGAPPAKDVKAVLAVPAGWSATPTSATSVDSIRPGRTATVTWRVTAPGGSLPSAVVLGATARYEQGDRRGSSADSRVVRSVPAPPTADTAVSAMPFLSQTNGWGPVERNTSNGEAAAGDGKPITLNGTVYVSGPGVHAPSDVGLYLGGHCGRFTAVVGVDDEVGDAGSVTFSVVADGVAVYTSPTVTGASAPLPVDVNIAGAQVVDLVVGEAGDGNAHDHADWADAKLLCS
jgi:beta-galactosidase GanA